MRILLLAPPGAGKGTQADRISAHFRVPHISTGDLFRRHVAEGTPLGREVDAYLRRGDLVPDHIVLGIVEEAVADALTRTGGYLLDGFPRTLAQARQGYQIARRLGATADAVLHFDVSEPELMRRLLERGLSDGRADDTEETIRHRIDVYKTETAPLLGYYRGRGVLVTIDAEKPVDQVTEESIAALEAMQETAGA
jgi:adenylate kinase